MTEETLIHWVRGQLTAKERRAVTEWMIRCQDPQLPLLLDGIMQAERDAARDRSLIGLGPAWKRIVGGWESLLEQGRAVLLDAPSGDFAMASTDELRDPLVLVERHGAPLVVLTAPASGDYSLLLSNDSGEVSLLYAGALQTGDTVQHALQAGGERRTLWALHGRAAAEMSPLQHLEAALSTPEATPVLSALRLDPRET